MPNTAPIRELLSSGQHLSHIVHFVPNRSSLGDHYTCLLFLEKMQFPKCRYLSVPILGLDGKRFRYQGEIAAETINGSVWNFSVGEDAELVERLKSMPVKLGDIADIFVACNQRR